MFTLLKVTDVKSGAPAPAACSVGLPMKKSGGREVWGEIGDRWGCDAAIASTRAGSRALVCSVNSTDAKGQDMNEVAQNIMVAACGGPQCCDGLNELACGAGRRPTARCGQQAPSRSPARAIDCHGSET
ncbi:hypothetical protein [Streptomyces sp. IBSBF 2806]|uniref:hypothetical protein n=1 Tax=Streptomyces sp. IBSBF 2806 TaxID=2903529 RepID=UPI003FA6E7DA